MRFALIPGLPDNTVRLMCLAEVDHVRLAVPTEAGVLPQIWLVYPHRAAKEILSLATVIGWIRSAPVAYVTPEHVAVVFQFSFEKGSLLFRMMASLAQFLVDIQGGQKIEVVACGEQDFDPDESAPFLEALRESQGIVELFVAEGNTEDFKPVWKTSLLSVQNSMPQLPAEYAEQSEVVM